MIDAPRRILVIEDNPVDFALLERHLRKHAAIGECLRVDDDTGLAQALEHNWDIVLSDYHVPGLDFRLTLRRVQAHYPDLPVILVSSFLAEDTAAELLGLGLADFVLKANLARLPSAIARAIDAVAQRRALHRAETALQGAQAVALEEQRRGRMAALGLMEEAEAARARAEAALAALKESEAKYRLLADNAADWIFWLGADNRYRYVSPACEAISGYPPDAFLADSHLLLQLIHPEDRLAYRAHLAQIDRADEEEMEMRLFDRHGAMHWVAHRCGPAYDPSGAYAGRRGAMRDITSRRLTDEKLWEREARYREMFAANPHPMWVLDAETLNFLDVNDAAICAYGYARAEFLAMSLADVRCDSLAGITETRCAAARPERHRRADETEILVDISAHGIDFAGRRALVVLANDVTQRVRAEQQLRKLSLAVEQSPESVVITDLDANIEYVNDAFLQVTGYAREEVLGRNPRVLNSGKTPSECYEALWSALTAGVSWSGEFINRRKDGTEYIEFATITPIREPDGRITHYVAVKEDITEKKRVAEELDRHRHQLEVLVGERTAQLAETRDRALAASMAKGAFIANMSHEIRTPMNAIMGLAHLLHQSELSEEQRDRLTKIDGAAQHLLAIINDILDVSKIEAGHMALEEVDFSLPDLLEETLGLIGDAAGRKGLAMEVECDDSQTWLRGDPTRLRQALLNYAGNAVKFTEHGRLILRATIEAKQAEAVRVRFEVEDTGVGIPPERLPQLFQAFEQADVTTARKYGGTGLGLAITRRLAELMGGEAGARSEPGSGSIFWFTAVLRPGTAHAQPRGGSAVDPAGDLARHHKGRRILLAEDNDVNREVALALLESAGLRVDVAVDGAQAVIKALANPYDLILMDMLMPELDGIEATRAIRRSPDRGEVPILAMTANTFEEDKRRCLEAGMNDFVAKPVDPAALYASLLANLGPGDRLAGGSAPPAHAAPSRPDSLRARLEEISGLDVDAGLIFAGGKWPFYVRMLRKFAQEHGQDIERIRGELAGEDLASAKRRAHTLKGMAATLGAEPLRLACLALEQAINAAPGPSGSLDARCEHVRAKLDELVAGVALLD